MRPGAETGAGAEIIFLINTVFPTVSLEDARIKTSIETYFLKYYCFSTVLIVNIWQELELEPEPEPKLWKRVEPEP